MSSCIRQTMGEIIFSPELLFLTFVYIHVIGEEQTSSKGNIRDPTWQEI